MYRKLRMGAAALLTAVLLTGCAAQTASQPKLLQEEVKTPSANLKVVTASVGTLQREYSMSAEPTVSGKTVLRLQAESAQYVEHCVTIGQEVKQGDVIAVFRKQADDIRLTAIELELEEIENERQDGLQERQEQKEALLERMSDIAPDENGYNDARSSAQLTLLQMDMEKLTIEQEQFSLRLDERARKLKEERSRLLEAESDLTVVAPMDGMVLSIAYLQPGVECAHGQEVAVLVDRQDVLLVADAGTLGDFRVGQAVTVQYGKRNARLTTTGRVVAADNLLKEEHKQGRAYIALDEDIPYEQLTQTKVSSMQMEAPGVLLLPRDAVQYDNGKPYVEVVAGTTASVRYVLTGPSDGESIMILAGIEENTPVLDK